MCVHVCSGAERSGALAALGSDGLTGLSEPPLRYCNLTSQLESVKNGKIPAERRVCLNLPCLHFKEKDRLETW